MRKFLIAISIIILVLISVSCTPEQQEGTIHLEGDSVTFNTYYGTGVIGMHTSAEFAPGSTADYSPWGEAAKERLPRYVAEGKVETLIWALGLNDISKDRSGWTIEDEDTWSNLLVGVVPATSCIVLVKPWVLDFEGRPVEEMEELRLWIDNLSAAHPNMVTVDWRPILEANPGFTQDGVHIQAGSGGPEARDAMYREGVSRCG